MNDHDYLFVGFNRRVAALDRHTGEVMWDWKAPKGSGFVTLLYDLGTLYASVQGYQYALDPRNGSELWTNPMRGYGLGVASLVTVRSGSSQSAVGESAAAAARAAAASTAATSPH